MGTSMLSHYREYTGSHVVCQEENWERRKNRYLSVLSLIFPDEAGQFAVFAGAVDREGLVMHYDVNAGREHAHCQKRFGQVLQAIARFEAQRGHGASEHDRYGQEVRQALLKQQ